MDNYSPCEQTIKIMYFAFTTFSTVGLGDFNYLNTSDFEIIFGTGMLLMGFVIFIYIISQYISMINTFIDFNKEIGDGEKLSQFFKVCEKYNDNKPLNFQLTKQIEQFFDHKWKNDKNSAFYDHRDLDLFSEIPQDTQDTLFY